MLIEDITPELVHDCQVISKEMAIDLIYKHIRKLSEIEKYIIRHSFGLPMGMDMSKWYEQMPRYKIAQELKISPKTVLKIRIEAEKKLFQMIFDREVKE
jgi:DNA-directed RNA polymerase specialized sigma subunit